jgi:hypothetical protein
MTKQEKFMELVQQLENIGDELNEFLEDYREENEDIDNAMMGLRISIDEISEIDIED